MEPFKDFKVYIRGASQKGRYEALYELVPEDGRRYITRQDLEDYVEKLQEKHPDKGFRLDTKRIGGRRFYVITRRSYEKLPDGSKRQVRDRVPIYFDLDSQKVYVPRWYVRNRRRLTNYILMRTLGSLGYATVKYKRITARREDYSYAPV
jgi:hypothetical protein